MKKNLLIRLNSLLLSVVVLLMLPELTFAQLAFPRAEGFGKNATGGRAIDERGSDVYHVTKLSDYKKDEPMEDVKEGTLRHAIESAEKPRTVVFDVSGNIKLLERKLTIRKSNLTIAGQTAPEGGITLYGFPLSIKGKKDGDNNIITPVKDIVIRYIRVRTGDFNHVDVVGDKLQPPKPGQLLGAEADAVTIQLAENVILDHVSLSWSMDEILDIGDSKSVTVQHSIISEPLHDSFHWEDSRHKEVQKPHGWAALFRGNNTPEEMDAGIKGYSIISSLFTHADRRMPVVGGEKSDPVTPDTKGLNIEFSNNVLYNWGVRSGHTATNAIVNMNYNNNYLISGETTEDPNLKTAFRVEQGGDDLDRFFIYYSGTYMDTDKDSDHDGAAVRDEAFIDFEEHERLGTPHNFPITEGGTAPESYTSVLANAGASSSRDHIDTRIVNGVINRTGKIINSQEQEEIGGIGSITEDHRQVDFDTDKDGMPDAWEITQGLDPNNQEDGKDTNISAEGYTNLEVYLDELTVIPATNESETLQD